ncbi:MAG: BPL-N domain-containing protein [Candidatus ainarchaeum sp.]|nr:BPL-N domain-containing protein [Candidatus ainarchaeum sp.]
MDTGVWADGVTAIEAFLTWKNLTWQEIDAGTINSYNISQYYKGIWMPGGWADDYKASISDTGDARIRELVRNGGAYVGTCAGAFYACSKHVWKGKRYNFPLQLYNGTCTGPINEIAVYPAYGMGDISINQSHPANIFEPAQRSVLYYGGPYFTPDANQESQVMARYLVPSNPAINNKPAVVAFNYGNGRAVLIGPHPENEEDSARDNTEFADELSDGPDGSDWPMMWTAMDWAFNKTITQAPPENPPVNDTTPPVIGGIADYPDPVAAPNEITFEANVTDDYGVNKVEVEFNAANHTMAKEESHVELFFDGFESGSFAAGGWATYGTGNSNWSVKTVAPYAGTYHAEVKYTGSSKYSYMEAAMGTGGYTNVTLTYYRQLLGLDSVDGFSAEWWSGTQWNAAESVTVADDAVYASRNFALPSAAGNNPNFKVRFMCEANAFSEGCRIDNVGIAGERSTDRWLYTHNTTGMEPGTYNYTVHATDTSNNTASASGTFVVQ